MEQNEAMVEQDFLNGLAVATALKMFVVLDEEFTHQRNICDHALSSLTFPELTAQWKRRKAIIIQRQRAVREMAQGLIDLPEDEWSIDAARAAVAFVQNVITDTEPELMVLGTPTYES